MTHDSAREVIARADPTTIGDVSMSVEAEFKKAADDAFAAFLVAFNNFERVMMGEVLSRHPEPPAGGDDWPARAVIDGDCISIRVPISALGIAFDCLPPGYGMRNAEGDPLFEVSDAAEFAKSVTRRLNDEEEDGTTLIHTMLDKAMAEAVEQGDEGVREIGNDD